jgi:DNA-binding NtrC family response regulator
MTDAKPTTVLLVEDEALVRMFADEVLTEEGGLKVIPASNADEAMAILYVRPDVRVLFTDVNMPGSMDGVQLAHAVRKRWPDIALIVTSGRGPSAPLPPGARFIMKPYTPDALVTMIKDMLRPPPEPIIIVRNKPSPKRTSGAPVLPMPVNLDGLDMGNGPTGGLAQPLPEADE